MYLNIFIQIAAPAVALLTFVFGVIYYNRRKTKTDTAIGLKKDIALKQFTDDKLRVETFLNEIRKGRIHIEDNLLHAKVIDATITAYINGLIDAYGFLEPFLVKQHYSIDNTEISVFCHGHQSLIRNFLANGASKNGRYSPEEREKHMAFLEEIKSREKKIKEAMSLILKTPELP